MSVHRYTDEQRHELALDRQQRRRCRETRERERPDERARHDARELVVIVLRARHDASVPSAISAATAATTPESMRSRGASRARRTRSSASRWNSRSCVACRLKLSSTLVYGAASAIASTTSTTSTSDTCILHAVNPLSPLSLSLSLSRSYPTIIDRPVSREPAEGSRPMRRRHRVELHSPRLPLAHAPPTPKPPNPTRYTFIRTNAHPRTHTHVHRQRYGWRSMQNSNER